MNAKSGLNLEKLIIGSKPLDSKVSIFHKIMRYLDIKEEPRHDYVSSMTMRVIYNQCIADIATICDTSMNCARRNIYYVNNWRQYHEMYNET